MASERRNPRSTADLLTWSETPLENPEPPRPIKVLRCRFSFNSGLFFIVFLKDNDLVSWEYLQPAGGVGKVLFGGQVTDEEAASLLKRCRSENSAEIFVLFMISCDFVDLGDCFDEKLRFLPVLVRFEWFCGNWSLLLPF